MPNTLTPLASTVVPDAVGQVCHDCAVLIVNDDDSHMGWEGECCRATLARFKEDRGLASLVVELMPEERESCDCLCCGDSISGTAWPVVGYPA